jgi:lipoprotein-releasing system permease protein
LNTSYLLAKRIRHSNISKSNVSARIIKIAILAVTIGIASILIAVFTGRGLQKAISKKTAAFNGHLVISTFENNSSQISINPFKIDEKYFSFLDNLENIQGYQKVAYKAGLIKFNNNYEGIILKGVDSSFNRSIFSEFLIQGRFPNLLKKNSNEIIK